MVIWLQDMPNIEVGVRSAWLAKERVRLIDGWKRHVIMGIQSYAHMGREAENRESPILVERISKDRWLVTHPVTWKGTQHRWIIGKLVNDVIKSGVQTLVIKSDQEASSLDVKNALMRELRSIEGEKLMLEESHVGASAASAVVERSVWEVESTAGFSMSGLITRRLNLALRSWHGLWSFPDRWLAGSRGVFFGGRNGGELVMFMPIEKRKDKGEVRYRVGIMLVLVDRSDEVVIGTPERAVKAGTVHGMPAGQRGDAGYAKSIRGASWQPNPAQTDEGEPVSIVSVPMVPTEHRPVVAVVEPREYRSRRFYIRREVGLVKFGYSENCDGCNAAHLGSEAKPHSEGCRERIRQAMMNDDMGQ